MSGISEAQFFSWFTYGWFGLAAVTFVSLQFLAAPYGRHERGGFGPRISNRVGWIIMEAPAALGVLLCYSIGPRSTLSTLFVGLYELHYIYRAFIFPFRLRSEKPMPLVVALSGAFFNVGNSYLIGRSVTAFSDLPTSWVFDPRFFLGLALFLGGMATHLHADEVLLNLRKPGETGYKIPVGGLYRFVSCPNYLGEMTEWLGFALLTWSTAGLAFFAFTVANLLPRALQHHKWYQEKFPDYPAQRRALVPLVL